MILLFYNWLWLISVVIELILDFILDEFRSSLLLFRTYRSPPFMVSTGVWWFFSSSTGMKWFAYLQVWLNSSFWRSKLASVGSLFAFFPPFIILCFWVLVWYRCFAIPGLVLWNLVLSLLCLVIPQWKSVREKLGRASSQDTPIPSFLSLHSLLVALVSHYLLALVEVQVLVNGWNSRLPSPLFLVVRFGWN